MTMLSSIPARLLRSAVDGLPAPAVQFAVLARSVLNPRPIPWDDAAVELFRAERRGRGRLPYPMYLYGLLCAARTARAVGLTAFSAVEFGVAGGNGLRAMEQHAERVEKWSGVEVSVFGLDSGAGLLEATDPRDCAFSLPPGEFAMDEARLRARLQRAELVLGPVEETVGPFMERAERGEIPPIGFVSQDLDVYTGTIATLRALPNSPERMLPRVPMYFDDLTGYPYTTEVAEWAAIRTHNEESPRRIGQMPNLEQSLGGAARFATWPRHMFALHVFDHPRYNDREAGHNAVLGLADRS